LNIEPRIVAELDPSRRSIRLARRIGPTVLPWWAIYADVTSHKLKTVRITDNGFIRTVSLCASRTLASNACLASCATSDRQRHQREVAQHESAERVSSALYAVLYRILMISIASLDSP
jgi:hypothetical protein